jgi:hypothetical protein
MNDPAMLLHIIQCHSDAVFVAKHRRDDIETMKTKLIFSMGGGNQIW